MSPQISNRGVAARYSAIGNIKMEEITSNDGFFNRIAKMDRIREPIINGQNRNAIITSNLQTLIRYLIFLKQSLSKCYKEGSSFYFPYLAFL